MTCITSGTPRMCQSESGETYAGPINTTIGNRECQPWALDEPHGHRQTFYRFPVSTITLG